MVRTTLGRVTEVIVVGAGLAGLHAARRLHRAGVAVTVLEARDRAGGRTWSQALRSGAVIERGGELIAPGADVLRGLAAELGLEPIRAGSRSTGGRCRIGPRRPRRSWRRSRRGPPGTRARAR
jgi:monoamine oxidase